MSGITNPVERTLIGVAKWLESLDDAYSGWNPHDEQFDNGCMSERRSVIEALRAAVSNEPNASGSLLREYISDALSSEGKHTSECAVFNAPAELPCSCNCTGEA